MNFSQLNFSVFSLKIYGFFLALAFFVGVWNFYKRVIQKEFSVDFFLHHFWRWVFGGIFLGRVFALFFLPSVFAQYGIFAFFAFWEGELHYLGIFLGFLMTMYFDLKKHKLNFLKWLDLAIPSAFLMLLIIDLAQFLTGAIYGKETDLPWGIYYETFGVELLNSLHPVSIYAFIAHFWMLNWVRKKERKFTKFPGKLALNAGICVFAFDFFLQFFRGDETILIINFWRIEQIFDLILILIFGAILRWQKK